MNETVILGINPTFFLKKVEPLTFPSRFMDGKFSEINVEFVKSLRSENQKLEKKQEKSIGIITKCKENKLFMLTDKNNNVFTCITTNNYDPDKPFQICMWSREQFNHTWVGIPYRMEIDSEGNYIFYTEGIYCCFECAYNDALFKARRSNHLSIGSCVSEDMLLKIWFNMCYPRKTLKYNPSPFYHETNLGPLTHDEYHSQKSIYIPTSGIVVIPSKKIAVKL